MILRNGKLSGKILRKIFWKIFHLTSLGFPGPPGWELGVGLKTTLCKTLIFLETSTEALDEEGGWGGHGPKTGRSAI
jgi:hypothetical protein